MSEPLTVEAFIEVTWREAFQRFGHGGRVAVMRALAARVAEAGAPRSAIWRRQGDELSAQWRAEAEAHRQYLPDAYHQGAIEFKQRCADELDTALRACAEVPAPPAEALEKLRWLKTPDAGGYSPLQRLRAHMAGNRNGKTLVARQALDALMSTALHFDSLQLRADAPETTEAATVPIPRFVATWLQDWAEADAEYQHEAACRWCAVNRGGHYRNCPRGLVVWAVENYIAAYRRAGQTAPPLPICAEALPPTEKGEVMEQENGEMHWKAGWMFTRVENGDVRIRKQISDPDGGEPLEVTALIPAAEWVSLIHHLGHAHTAEAFQVAREFHGAF